MAITIADIREYQKRRKTITTIGPYKRLGRELADKFGLTDREAIAIMNDDNEAILKILENQEVDK